MVRQWSGQWPGQWSQSVVWSVVRSVIQLAIRSVVRSVIWSIVRFVVWWMVQCVVRPVRSLVRSKHVLLHTTACQLEMLGYWSASGLVFLCSPISTVSLGSNITILESQSDRPCRGFRVSHGPVLRWRCGAVAVLLRCCCGVVACGGGQLSQSMVRCSVIDLVGESAGGLPVCPPVGAVGGPSLSGRRYLTASTSNVLSVQALPRCAAM